MTDASASGQPAKAASTATANGLGGVPNPAAPNETIPPLSGTDFRTELNVDAKTIDFVETRQSARRAGS